MLMGALTPRPHEVRKHFEELLSQDPQAATDWFYKFSQDTDYIRRYRIQKDMHWLAATEYGTLDMTINLSKPEKIPRPSQPPLLPRWQDTLNACSARKRGIRRENESPRPAESSHYPSQT